MGTSVKLIGKGLNTSKLHEPVLDAAQLAQLTLIALVQCYRVQSEHLLAMPEGGEDSDFERIRDLGRELPEWDS
jgi:hypothetical protein